MNKQNLYVLIICLSIVLVISYVVKKRQKPVVLPPTTIEQRVAPEEKPEPPAPTFEDAVASIDETSLKENLVYLASDELEGRMSGKQGNVVAAKYIFDKYESLGLKPQYQKFSISRVNAGPKNERGDDFTQNIIAYIPGTEKPNEIVVIGAHMDHIGYGPQMSRSQKIAIHPGADDNASGTVALLEIAKAFSKLKPKRTVVFQSYSAEEMGLIGSRYYCEHPLFPLDNPSISSHVFMLNMDMVGYLDKGVFFTGFYDGDSSATITELINQLNQKYVFAKKITSQGSGGSDHAPFYNKHIPIAFLHTGLHAYYHTPEDTSDKINYSGIGKVAKYGFELAWKVANEESKPIFNVAAFKPMEYTHDHGHPGVEFYYHKYHKH